MRGCGWKCGRDVGVERGRGVQAEVRSKNLLADAVEARLEMVIGRYLRIWMHVLQAKHRFIPIVRASVCLGMLPTPPDHGERMRRHVQTAPSSSECSGA